MNQRKTIGFAAFLIALICLTLFAAAQTSMSVQVKEARLRSAPSFLGKTVATVPYTKQVGVREKKGDWSRVTLPGSQVEGWMHNSALTKKKIIRNPGAEDAKLAASSDEVALAGKGLFSAETEEKFKKGKGHLNYQAVDIMETHIVSQDQMRIFLQEGGLSSEGGV